MHPVHPQGWSRPERPEGDPGQSGRLVSRARCELKVIGQGYVHAGKEDMVFWAL